MGETRKIAAILVADMVGYSRLAVMDVDHAAKLNEAAVPGSLDDATVMNGDGRVDEIAAEGSESRQRHGELARALPRAKAQQSRAALSVRRRTDFARLPKALLKAGLPG
jgi:hypothetical protein